jgi:hypothetical protein
MDGEGSMTLAFELSALKSLADPGEVFSAARQWSQYVGVVSDEPTYAVTNFTRKRRIRQDFFSGPKGKGESLEAVKSQFDTDRHVFIGTTDEDRALADEHGWEYLPIEEAAGAAEWELGEEEDEANAPVEDQRDDWP